MAVADVQPELLNDFAWCVDREQVSSLGDYLPDFVRGDQEVDPADYRLMPITAATMQYAQSGCHCVTDCMFELQAKYEHFIPDDWGGRMDRGWRDAAVIGFNANAGVSLDIEELAETACHYDWAEPRLACLDWARLLVHAVLDFAKTCGARRVTLNIELADIAQQCGFEYSEADERFAMVVD